MQLSLLLGQNILSMFLIMVLGYFLIRKGFLKESDTSVLARINMLVIGPCAIVGSFQMKFTMEKLTGLLVAILAAIVIHIMYLVLERLLRGPLHLKPVESATVIYSNALNLILPLILATMEEEMIFYSSAFMLVQTFLLWTHCKCLISGEKHIRVKDFWNPNLMAIVIGLVLYLCRIELPGILNTSVKNLGSMIGPMSMLVIGMLLGPVDLKKAFSTPRVYLIVALRLLVFPALTVLLLRYSGLMSLHVLAPKIFLVTTLAAASCAAATVPQQARVYGKDADYASMLGAATMVFCVITMPLIVGLYQVLV